MQKTNVVIVLVNTSSPGNIGSTARAMKNFGITDLRLVSPVPWRDNEEYLSEAERMAWGAVDVLHAAKVFDAIPEAISDCQVVYGTSARPGRYRDPLELREAAPEIAEGTKNYKTAILFGSEKSGLSTKELSYCQKLLTINTSDMYPTLNLSQTVLLVCYQLEIALSSACDEALFLADHDELERFYDHARRVLLDIGFLNRQNPDHGLEIFRKIFGRSGLTSGEVRTLRGIFRQIDWASHRWNPSLW